MKKLRRYTRRQMRAYKSDKNLYPKLTWEERERRKHQNHVCSRERIRCREWLAAQESKKKRRRDRSSE